MSTGRRAALNGPPLGRRTSRIRVQRNDFGL
jgi:hypothetical protein